MDRHDRGGPRGVGTMKAVDTAPHEYMANYLYDDGLGPWFGAARLCDATGSRRGTFRLDGEEWRVTLSYQESGLAPPDGGEDCEEADRC